MLLNFAIPQLFFLVYPSVLDSLAQFDLQFGTARLAARFVLAVLWWLLGWKIAFKMLRRKENVLVKDSSVNCHSQPSLAA
jgi:hypothetical protein